MYKFVLKYVDTIQNVGCSCTIELEVRPASYVSFAVRIFGRCWVSRVQFFIIFIIQLRCSDARKLSFFVVISDLFA